MTSLALSSSRVYTSLSLTSLGSNSHPSVVLTTRTPGVCSLPPSSPYEQFQLNREKQKTNKKTPQNNSPRNTTGSIRFHVKEAKRWASGLAWQQSHQGPRLFYLRSQNECWSSSSHIIVPHTKNETVKGAPLLGMLPLRLLPGTASQSCCFYLIGQDLVTGSNLAASKARTCGHWSE